MNPPPRRLYVPRPAQVEAGAGGVPVAVGSVAVEAVREEWVVEDRWWTPRPLRRRYFELVLADGRDVVVFKAAGNGRWYLQRA
jgi:hypothetical protein